MDAEKVFLTCISKVKSPTLKKRLNSITFAIKEYSEKFDEKAIKSELYTLSEHDSVNNVVTKDEMIKVYTSRMVDRKQPGRNIYDKLLLMPRHGICPLCGQRTVATLDHHLTKDKYPMLAVTPNNLIAACFDCNKVKHTIIPSKAEEQTLHPYYDDITTEYWLHAKVIQDSTVSLMFFVKALEDCDRLLSARIQYHFRIFELGALYAAHSGSELVNIKENLESLYDQGGSNLVREQLNENAKSYGAANKNSWQTAMYRGLAENNWFCEGGFKNV